MNILIETSDKYQKMKVFGNTVDETGLHADKMTELIGKNNVLERSLVKQIPPSSEINPNWQFYIVLTLGKKPVIYFYGKRWFSKSCGNTYHSVQVCKGHEVVGSMNFAYGYDDHYIQTGHEILVAAGLAPEDYQEFMDQVRNNRELFSFSVVDVSRRRDL